MTWTPSVASCHQRMWGRLLMNATSSVTCTISTATITPNTIQNTMSAAASYVSSVRPSVTLRATSAMSGSCSWRITNRYTTENAPMAKLRIQKN